MDNLVNEKYDYMEDEQEIQSLWSLAYVKSKVEQWMSVRAAAPRLSTITSFLKPELFSVLASAHSPTELHFTSWADGLRGYSAVSVMLWHYFAPYYPTLPYGYGERDQLKHFGLLPIIRLPYGCGLSSVSLFFIL